MAEEIIRRIIYTTYIYTTHMTYTSSARGTISSRFLCETNHVHFSANRLAVVSTSELLSDVVTDTCAGPEMDSSC